MFIFWLLLLLLLLFLHIRVIVHRIKHFLDGFFVIFPLVSSLSLTTAPKPFIYIFTKPRLSTHSEQMLQRPEIKTKRPINEDIFWKSQSLGFFHFTRSPAQPCIFNSVHHAPNHPQPPVLQRMHRSSAPCSIHQQLSGSPILKVTGGELSSVIDREKRGDRKRSGGEKHDIMWERGNVWDMQTEKSKG